LIILDDPLSALDAGVGKFIFKHTILDHLKNKSVLLVTHALYFANEFDYIYLFEKGKIVSEGDFDLVSKTKMFQGLSAL